MVLVNKSYATSDEKSALSVSLKSCDAKKLYSLYHYFADQAFLMASE